MARPRELSRRLIPVGTVSDEEARQIGIRLLQISGVAEAVVIAEEGIAYLKVDSRSVDVAALDEISVARA